MVKGFDKVNQALEINANAMINDAARSIRDNLMRSHSELNLSIKRMETTETTTKLQISGMSDIDSEKRKTVNNKIDNLVKNVISSDG